MTLEERVEVAAEYPCPCQCVEIVALVCEAYAYSNSGKNKEARNALAKCKNLLGVENN